MKLLKLAWRNVWRNRRRSLITMGSIVFAVVLVTATDSLQNGTYDLMERIAVRLFTGDMQVHRAGYNDDKTLELTLETGERPWDEMLDKEQWMTAYSKRLSNFGLISSDSSSTGALIVGVEPEKEVRISAFIRNVFEGEQLETGDSGSVLIGSAMAQNLELAVGDSLVILSQGYQGTMSYGIYRIKGILKTGSIEFDRNLVVMTLPAAQELFWMYDRFSELVIATHDFRSASTYSGELDRRLPSDLYEVMSWEDLLPEIKQARQFDDIGNRVFYAFLILIIGFEIFNTASMSVIERTREFGVLQAIGMRPIQISQLVFLELMFKVVMAIAVGFLITYALLAIYGDTVIPLGAELTEMYAELGFQIDGIQFSRRPSVFYTPVFAVGLVSVLAVIYPVIRAYRYMPVEALRRN